MADCNPFTTQTPHRVLLTAAGDGSVRGVSGAVAASAWRSALLPADGGPGGDW